MSTKKCCYINRECTPKCVAYSVDNEISGGAESLGLNDMHCVRLLVELTNLMNLSGLMDFEDYDDDYEDEEDEDDEDEF
jgi:hypothetical protein